jgi:hypothetical protein
MAWTVAFHPRFAAEVDDYSGDGRRGLIAVAMLFADAGPQLRRPLCDTLAGSRHANMKELRFVADDGMWRIAFAFDPERQAILLAGGDRPG